MERLVVRLVQRGWRLLRALDDVAGIDMEELSDGPILSLLAVDSTWMDLLCHLARHELRPADLRSFVGDIRRLAREQMLLRRAIYRQLAEEDRKMVAVAEQACRVGEQEVRQAVTEVLLAVEDEEGELLPDLDAESPPGTESRDGIVLCEVNALLRADWESRPLPPSGRLRPALRSLPAEWFDAICAATGGPAGGARRYREAGLVAHLEKESTQGQLLRRLGAEGRLALDALLSANGLIDACALTARVGSDGEDGWFWTDRPPSSPLGLLRHLGIAYVGGADLGSGWRRAVLLPVELRLPVDRLLRGA